MPIPPYTELKVNLVLLKAERDTVAALRDQSKDDSDYHRDKMTGADLVLTRHANKRAADYHMKQQQDELEDLETLIHSTHDDMWDHQSLARGCLPLSSKRKEYSLAICGMSRQAFDRGRWLAFDRERWVRDHLPADIRAQQRACALERWRKAAYLLGVLTFWRRVTNAAGSKASCAALARVTKRARTA